MGQRTRPFGVSFAAGWAAIGGVLSLLSAFGVTMVGTRPGPAESCIFFAIVFGALSLLIGFGLLVVAGGLYWVKSWARGVGMVLFGLFALLNLYSLIDGSVLAVIDLSLNVAALTLLAVDVAAFRADRTTVSEGSALQVGRT
ncbi:MAG: uncharacterized membrane protein (DUF2068 family) [Halobacteriales archaeon]|jgi:uncharacterized membrane protein (DUF2068 family)